MSIISTIEAVAWLVVPGLVLVALISLWRRTRLYGILWIAAGVLLAWVLTFWAASDWLFPSSGRSIDDAERILTVIEHQSLIQLAILSLVSIGCVLVSIGKSKNHQKAD